MSGSANMKYRIRANTYSNFGPYSSDGIVNVFHVQRKEFLFWVTVSQHTDIGSAEVALYKIKQIEALYNGKSVKINEPHR